MGSMACSSLVMKIARIGTGALEQEVHIAGQVERLQQNAEAGEQDRREGARDHQRGHALQQRLGIAHELRQVGRAQEAQQQPAQHEGDDQASHAQ